MGNGRKVMFRAQRSTYRYFRHRSFQAPRNIRITPILLDTNGLGIVPSGLSLAYIGTASVTEFCVSLRVDPRRFRLGDEKEGAGAAVAVILVGIMEIEQGFVIGWMLLVLASSPMVMKSGKQLPARSRVEPFGMGVEGDLEAVVHCGHRLLRRRAWSKPAVRI